MSYPAIFATSARKSVVHVITAATDAYADPEHAACQELSMMSPLMRMPRVSSVL